MLLDEIGDVPLAVQVKLLRAIEHREVTPVGDARPRPINVRFLAATNRPLDALMASRSSSGRTSSSGSASSRSTCLRYAIGAKTSRRWRPIS